MHESVGRAFDDILRARRAGGAVLEIGATPTRDTLLFLPALRDASQRVGLDLAGPYELDGVRILRGDANRMELADGSFDTIVCNSVLEHDRFFWRTLAEIRRVARRGALIVLGVPGYIAAPPPFARVLRHCRRLPIVGSRVEAVLASTPTLLVHNHPGDYYRFSPQAMREVLLEGLADVEVRHVLTPPRILGAGVVR